MAIAIAMAIIAVSIIAMARMRTAIVAMTPITIHTITMIAMDKKNLVPQSQEEYCVEQIKNKSYKCIWHHENFGVCYLQLKGFFSIAHKRGMHIATTVYMNYLQ